MRGQVQPSQLAVLGEAMGNGTMARRKDLLCGEHGTDDPSALVSWLIRGLGLLFGCRVLGGGVLKLGRPAQQELHASAVSLQCAPDSASRRFAPLPDLLYDVQYVCSIT